MRCTQASARVSTSASTRRSAASSGPPSATASSSRNWSLQGSHPFNQQLGMTLGSELFWQAD